VGEGGLSRARRLAALLGEDRVDLVHAWLFIANTYAWMARCLGARAPLVTSVRNCKSQGWAHHAANVAALRSSARIVVNSGEVREYIVRRYRARPGRVDVVYNAVDTERFRPPPSRPAGAPRVVGVGRLVAQKNPELFVEAAARVHAELPEVRFSFIGDGPLRGAVAERARGLGLGDAFELPGERHDVERILAEAHSLWLTSSWEGLPNVVMEAMACGLPVVASDVGGTRELFASGVEGFLVRAREADDFATYGLRLLRDRALTERIGIAARRRALQFSRRRMVGATESVYRAALDGERQ
jgi:glycosyltransferase involved in cell wall biosynthesis